LSPDQRLQLLKEGIRHLQESATKLDAAGVDQPAEHLRRIAEQLVKQAEESAARLRRQEAD
jgi:hypothetical protein